MTVQTLVPGNTSTGPVEVSAGRATPVAELRRLSARVRSVVLEMIHRSGSGHIGSSLSCADAITALRFDQMRWSDEPADRDVFVLSKGHGVPAWYAALIVGGNLDRSLIDQLRTIDSPLQGHPDRVRCAFVDVSTGALGQGLSIAIGRAEARRLRDEPGHVFCVLGDGECQEGQTWEAALYAGARPVSNVVAIVDRNGMQSDGPVDGTVPLGALHEKFRSFGWHVQEVDGHAHTELGDAVDAAKFCTTAPSMIIAHTLKGYLGGGRQVLNGAHGGALNPDEYSDAMSFLGRQS